MGLKGVGVGSTVVVDGANREFGVASYKLSVDPNPNSRHKLHCTFYSWNYPSIRVKV